MGIKVPSLDRWHCRPHGFRADWPPILAGLAVERPGNPEAETVETVVGRVLVARGRTKRLLIIVPRAAANHMAAAIAAYFRRAVGRLCAVKAVAIRGQFP